ncbi:hypothetical protein HNY73_021572 [Argiope bruennichi]|uniref:Uncharacterized protein n=1 Tax=Argiope bruennichi TaxID=94029 RepID=A0A8T0E268_ARGBR|nr:hypothetical protein HNY73_021572 [Argiope bruennichi]
MVKNSKTLLENYKTEAAELRNHIDEFKKVLEGIHNESFGLQKYMDRAPRVSGSQEDYSIDIIGPIGGEIPEYDLLAETLPLRYPRLRRRPLSPVSPLLSDESSVEEQPLPMGGLGVIRLDDSDEWQAVGGGSPTQQDRGAPTRAQLRFVNGQWIEVVERTPLATQQFEPQRGADLMGPVRLDQASWAPIGGRVSPVSQVQSPREPFRPTGPMRFIDGQWVPITSPQRLSPPRLHSTPRQISPGRSHIPVSLGISSPGLDVSSIRAPSPIRSPIRLDVPMRLTTPRAGTAHRFGVPSMVPARAMTPPRLIVPGARPTAMRRGTPPRPRIPTRQPMIQRGRIPQRTGFPTAARGGIPQRMGISSMRSTAITPSPAGGLMSRVMLFSPQQLGPIPLDIDVTPQDIYPLSGEVELLSEVDGDTLQPVIPEMQNIRRERRVRRPRQQFIPRTGF